MDDKAVDRIFMGSLVNMPPVGSKIVRIFTSSTFTDMSMERNHLMEDVYPRLKEFCRDKHGLEFQVVDMRWGVRDEATDDHMTTELCMREIQNCQRLSMGPNFVVFLGQKYGYRPIPTIIDGKEFAMIRETLITMGASVELLDTWYKEDTNAVPSVQILQPISSILANFNNKKAPTLQAEDQATWWSTLESLQKLFRQATLFLYNSNQIDSDARHNYMMSVTEREVINGILKVRNTKNHCIAYVRHINNINMGNLSAASKFIDIINKCVDTEAQELLSDLRDKRLVEKIETSNIMKYEVEWNGRDGLDDVTHKEYLQHFKAHFYKYITKLVDRAMRKEDLSSQGQILTEILQHLHACNNSVEVFQGRREELAAIENYIISDNRKPFVLVGEGGSGKTSLLSKAASMVPVWCGKDRKPLLIIRFLGTTPDSSSVIPMLTSVCQQICYNYLIPWTEIPDELVPLTAFFKHLLTQATKEQPLYIFLDSVDQLSAVNATNRLTWLPSQLPEGIKVVVSVVLQEDSPDLVFLQRLLEEEKCFLHVNALGRDLAIQVIETWLSKNKRDLAPHQWDIVNTAISKCTLPIFVKLVFAEVIRWKSYTRQSDATLAYTVMDSIMNLFDRIEKQHGKVLVFHALAYITASRNGLSEAELEDLISLDDIVLDDVYQYHMPPVRRIPPLLWTRIRNDLPNYLIETEAGGVSVQNWYHRQFRQAAIERYFKNKNMISYFHSSIADYFLGIWGGGNPKPFTYTEVQRQRFGLSGKHGEADRKVPLQPNYYYSNDGRTIRYNLRKFGELPFHLVRSQRFNDLFDHILFNFSWLQSKLSSCPIQSVLADFEDACNHLTDCSAKKEAILVADALRLGAAILSQYPDMLASQLLARLLPLKNNYLHIRSLLEECDRSGPDYCALLPCYHCLHTPGGPLRYSLEGQQFGVFGFVLSSDNRHVLSVSNRFIMWDLSTGEVTRDIDPDIPGIMQTLVISEDDRYAVSYTNYNHMVILNLLSGELYKDKIEDEILGMDIVGTSMVVWCGSHWMIYRLETRKEVLKHTIVDSQLVLLNVVYCSSNYYHLLLGSKIKPNHILRTVINDNSVDDIPFCGGIAFASKKGRAFLTQKTVSGTYNVVSYSLLHKTSWIQEKVLYNTNSKILELTFVAREQFLVGMMTQCFVLWDFHKENKITLTLPENTRNVSVKPMKSQSSFVLTKDNKYAVAGVRKDLYIWDISTKDLIKTVDAHFGRILLLRPLVIDDLDAIISSSLDRTVKVWNVRNIFEQVHAIDRMENGIDGISLADKCDLAITVTRSCIGVWTLSTGKLLAKLADSAVGAIVTHAEITGDGKFVVCSESGNFLVWSVETCSVVKKTPHANICQIILCGNDKTAIIFSFQNEGEVSCTAQGVPECNEIYSFTAEIMTYRKAVVTYGGDFLVFIGLYKERENILVYRANEGTLVHRIALKLHSIKGFSSIVPISGHSEYIGIVGGLKSCIIDIKSRKLIRTYRRWSGACTKNGKLGLHAPMQGGLELIELKKGTIVRVLLPPISEGMFNVLATFTQSDQHVIYYHSGKRTIRLFRTADGKQLANYRLQADATVITSSNDGLSLVVGGVDGSFVVLQIVDPSMPETRQHLNVLPSRSDSTGGIKVTSKIK